MLRQSDIKILLRTTIKGQVLANFVAEFSPRDVSSEKCCLVSAHKEGESSEAGSPKSQSLFGGPEVTQEPSQNTETIAVGQMSGVPKVTKPS